MITFPTSDAIQATCHTFRYLVAGSQLYKLDFTSNSLTKIYSFNTYKIFSLYNYQNRIIAAGSNYIQISNFSYTSNSTIYYLKEENGAIIKIGTKDIANNGMSQSVAIVSS
jgi:hypothetical protein